MGGAIVVSEPTRKISPKGRKSLCWQQRQRPRGRTGTSESGRSYTAGGWNGGSWGPHCRPPPLSLPLEPGAPSLLLLFSSPFLLSHPLLPAPWPGVGVLLKITAAEVRGRDPLRMVCVHLWPVSALLEGIFVCSWSLYLRLTMKIKNKGVLGLPWWRSG